MSSEESNQLPNETRSLEIKKDSFELNGWYLGSGSFGTVVVAALKRATSGSEAPAEVAAKSLRLNEFDIKSKGPASRLEHQARAWSNCSHGNVLEFIGYYIEESSMNAILFLPYMRHGNARQYLEGKRSTMEDRISLLKDTMIGLEYLHDSTPPVVHGNLKAANVLVNDNGRAVLSDIGLYTLLDTQELTNEMKYSSMTRYSSPESLSNLNKTTESDIWAWGCLALEIMTEQIPFPDKSWSEDAYETILSGQTPEPNPPPQNWPDGLLELVRKCWSQKPEDRPNAPTCLESVNKALNLAKKIREEGAASWGSSFIEAERLQSGADPILPGGQFTTTKAELSPSGALVVVKERYLDQINSISLRVEFLKRFVRQTAVLSSLKHENILEFIGYSTKGYSETVAFLTANMVNGNLADYMHKGLDRNRVLELARDTLYGLEYLHGREPPVIHGNITPFNVLINETEKAVLTDVGLTVIDWQPMTNPLASVRWSSPEVNLEGSAVIPSDMWSWACVVLQLITNSHPYSPIQSDDHIKEIMSFGAKGFLTPEAFHEPDEIPNVLLQLLARCWEFDSSERPNARECMDVLSSMLGPDLDAFSATESQQLPDDVSPRPQLKAEDVGSDEQIVRTFKSEIDTGRHLERPHVLKFAGTYPHEPDIFFISPFAKIGSWLKCGGNFPGVNCVRLVCGASDAEPNQILLADGYRTTKRAKLQPLNVLVVMKELPIWDPSSRIGFFKRFSQQIDALWSLKHEHIVEFIGYTAATGFEAVSLVTHHMGNGNLVDYVHEELDRSTRLELARDITNGLQYLHNRDPPIVHGRLNPFNVLVSDTGKAVLDDYVLEVIATQQPPAIVRSPSVRWSSREVNLGEKAVIQSDIWSWACVVLQLVTGDHPYLSIESEEHIKLVMSFGKRGFLIPGASHDLDDIPDVLMQLFRRCWEFESFIRPTVRECLDTLNTMLNVDLDTHSENATSSLGDDVSRFITSVSSQAICINGRFGDVFRGTHKTMGEVALKRLRIGSAAHDEQVIRRFEREADTWRRLEHPHVLKFLGTYKPEGHLYFVSPFMQNGTLLEYLNDHPNVNRVKLLCETSDAIDYLHRENIIHGDIKAGNLLISDHGHVLLCDFGLTKPTYAQTSTALKGAGTVRWQSPELWDNAPRSFASDAYAFSMTITEVLTGLPPFCHLENEMAVMMAVYQRDVRPVQSPLEFGGVSYENAWRVAEACWSRMPGNRISMSEAFRLLKADPSLA